MEYYLKKLALLGFATWIFVGCNASRVVTPLEEGEWRIGGAVGGPTVNTSRLPLMSIYAAHGHTSESSDYLGLALTSLGFQTVQMDVGRLTRLLPQDGWRPELNANFGGNLFVGLRDGAVRSYPHLGNQLVWKRGRFLPYMGHETWIDPTYRLVDNQKGSLIHPSLHTGLRYVGKRIEWGIEAKWLNPTRTFVIPQQTVPTLFGSGASGIYYTLAFRLP